VGGWWEVMVGGCCLACVLVVSECASKVGCCVGGGIEWGEIVRSVISLRG
jgi:hypothetical protein